MVLTHRNRKAFIWPDSCFAGHRRGFAVWFTNRVCLRGRSLITSSSDEKLERAQALGAHAGINYARTPEWEKEVLRLTDKQGADHVLEVAGGKSLAQSLASSKPGGRISVIGVLDGFVSELPIFLLLIKQVTVRGMLTGPRRLFEEMNEALQKIQIHPVIDRVYSFADALAA